MSFGNILGQLMQDGVGRQSSTRSRIGQSAQNLDQGGPGIESIFTQLQGALGGGGRSAPSGSGGSFGGLADRARDFMGKEQAGGMTGGQIGGIGAVAGALLGGGLGGAARGGALAVLGTLALGALKSAQSRGGNPASVPVEPADVESLTGPRTERLLLRAMISAAKADGQIDPTEMQTILGKLDSNAVTEDEKQFVMAEMRAPVDVRALAGEVENQAQAAEVYAASIISIDIDTDAEKAYLRELARTLNLDEATVRHLHEMTGAPVTA